MLLHQDRFEADVLESSAPVLVDFYATWCPPCQRLAPTIDRIAEAGYAVSKVNVEERGDLATRFGVSSLPTVMVLKGGQEVARFIGPQREETLRKALDAAATR